MRMLRLIPFLLIALPIGARADEPGVAFERDVRPIFKAACFQCHGEEEELEGNLDLRLVRFMTTGGDSGPAIVAGDREESYLYQRVRDGEMPPDEAHGLTDEEIETIGRWIDSGAATLRPEPEEFNGFLITEEERSHWAFQPIVRPAVPEVTRTLEASGSLVRNPIDAFLLPRLQADGFTFSAEAAPEVLLRRLYLDLIGLPPTPEQANRFLADDGSLAFKRLVDELLASPRYGERWARHWLDVAGYADSDGYTNQDLERPHLYRYRDYVIRSFNADKPFDQFIREQLAGDEMVSTPLDNLSPEDAELLTATGFLRTAPDGTGGAVDDANLARNDVIAETIKIVSSSFMGLTVGCAQCHDHRYDPIPQTDYYQVRAIFEPALNPQQWRNPQQRRVSLYTDEDRARAAEIEEQAQELDAARTGKQQEFIQATFEREVGKLPEELQQPARDARETPEAERTPEQQELLKTHPSLNVSAGSLYLYDKAAADELEAMADEAAAVRATKPVEEFVGALTEVPGQVPVTHLFVRGDHEQPQDELSPTGLSVVSLTTDVPDIPGNDPEIATTGRRTAFAARITDANYPLTARVLVNRIWMHHFGLGLVSTPGDFGVLGTPPTHPELLDWLAREFIDSGWSVKHMHRLIVTSTAWRQSLRTNSELESADPDNLLYGGSRLQRLDAEGLRDSVLAVSGQLNDTLYGQPVPIMADRVGRWVLGVENLNAGRPGDVIPLKGQEYRRSIYVQVRRSRPLAVLDTFDWPRMSPNCDVRRSSTGAPQSLMLMNSDFVLGYADSFATRVVQEAGEDRREQVVRAWRLAFCRLPEESEIASAITFLDDQAALFEQSGGDESNETPTPEQRALSSLCQMLLSSNAFLYVD